MPIPELGKIYNCFDDGKIRESRRYAVTVKSITPFNQADEPTIYEWECAATQYDWLYKTETDYFIETINEDGGRETFCRTKDDGWFGFNADIIYGIGDGRLDVDGSLSKMCAE